jgi:hypothetical protein
MEFWDSAAWTAVGAPPVAGLGINISVTGAIVKVAIPQASTPPTPGAGAAQAVVGSMYWDDVLNQLFIYYRNGGTPIWVQAAPSASGGSTYTATAPIVVTGTVISVNLGLGLVANGTNLALSIPVAATPPAINTTATGALDGSFYWDNTLGQLVIRYNNSGSPVWVAAAPPAGGGGGTSPIPAGTRMTFQQTAAPTGWVKDTTYNNYAMRIVNGAAGIGGTVGFTTAFASGLSSAGHTLTIAEMPSHDHAWGGVNSGLAGVNAGALLTNNSAITGATGGGGSHAHSLPSFAVKYVDTIIATKN